MIAHSTHSVELNSGSSTQTMSCVTLNKLKQDIVYKKVGFVMEKYKILGDLFVVDEKTDRLFKVVSYYRREKYGFIEKVRSVYKSSAGIDQLMENLPSSVSLILESVVNTCSAETDFAEYDSTKLYREYYRNFDVTSTVEDLVSMYLMVLGLGDEVDNYRAFVKKEINRLAYFSELNRGVLKCCESWLNRITVSYLKGIPEFMERKNDVEIYGNVKKEFFKMPSTFNVFFRIFEIIFDGSAETTIDIGRKKGNLSDYKLQPEKARKIVDKITGSFDDYTEIEFLDLLQGAFKADPLSERVIQSVMLFGDDGDMVEIKRFAEHYGFYDRCKLVVDKTKNEAFKEDLNAVKKLIEKHIFDNNDFFIGFDICCKLARCGVTTDDYLLRLFTKRAECGIIKEHRNAVLACVKHLDDLHLFDDQLIKRIALIVDETDSPDIKESNLCFLAECVCNDAAQDKSNSGINFIKNINIKYIDDYKSFYSVKAHIPEDAKVYMLYGRSSVNGSYTNAIALTNYGVHCYYRDKYGFQYDFLYFTWVRFSQINMELVSDGIKFNDRLFFEHSKAKELYEILKNIQMLFTDYINDTKGINSVNPLVVFLRYQDPYEQGERKFPVFNLTESECDQELKKLCVSLSARYEPIDYDVAQADSGIRVRMYANTNIINMFPYYNECVKKCRIKSGEEIIFLYVFFFAKNNTQVYQIVAVTRAGMYFYCAGDEKKTEFFNWVELWQDMNEFWCYDDIFSRKKLTIYCIADICREYVCGIVSASQEKAKREYKQHRNLLGVYEDELIAACVKNVINSHRTEKIGEWLPFEDHDKYELKHRYQMDVDPADELFWYIRSGNISKTQHEQSMILTDRSLYWHQSGEVYSEEWLNFDCEITAEINGTVKFDDKPVYIPNGPEELIHGYRLARLLKEIQQKCEDKSDEIFLEYRRYHTDYSKIIPKTNGIRVYNQCDEDIDIDLLIDQTDVGFRKILNTIKSKFNIDLGRTRCYIYLPSCKKSFLVTSDYLISHNNESYCFAPVSDIITLKIEKTPQGKTALTVVLDRDKIIVCNIFLDDSLADIDLSKVNDKLYSEFPFSHANYFINGRGVEKNLDRAVDLLEMVRDTNYNTAQYMKAKIYHQKGKLNQAVEAYKSIDMPGNMQVEYELAMLYYENRNFEFSGKDYHLSVVIALDKLAASKYGDSAAKLLDILDDADWMRNAESEAQIDNKQEVLSSIIKRRGMTTGEYTVSQIKNRFSKFKTSVNSFLNDKNRSVSSPSESLSRFCPKCGTKRVQNSLFCGN